MLAPIQRPGHEPGFWCRYVKGAARAATALALARLVLQWPGGVPGCAAQFLAGLRGIAVVRGCIAVDLTSIAFENARVSSRGAIRRAHDVLTWVSKLRVLQRAGGVEPATVLKKWNSTATTAQQLVGSKRVAVQHLLEKVPDQAIDLLLDHYSEVGGDGSCFSEEAFANKRLLPGGGGGGGGGGAPPPPPP